MNDKKMCNKCKREFPLNTDYFYKKCDTKDGFASLCKECCGRHFTNKLTHIPKDGFVFCKKCDRELPHTFQYFPEDRSCKNGLRYVCRECDKSYGRFLDNNEEPHRAWSKEEIELLKSVYSNHTGLEILDNNFFPGRTLRAIESQASILGIKKTKETRIKSYKHQSELVSEMFKGRNIEQEWKDKISVTKKEYYKNHDNWWKGKKRSKEQCEFMSNLRKERGCWSGENNPRHINPLCGDKNGRWKGGILDTYLELRSETKDWFNESIEFCGYKCVITKGEFDNVHHTTAFRDIVDEVFKNTKIEVKPKVCDYKNEEFEILRDALKKLHIEYGFGACVNKDVHKLFHDNYGYTKFSPYDFLDFCYRIDCGEFDKWFNYNNLKIDLNYNFINYLESTLINFKSA